MSKFTERQALLREIIREKEVRTQQELVEVLKARGYNCTQATISRDIRMLGLKKISGGPYVLDEDLQLNRMTKELIMSVVEVGNLVVVKTMPGMAQGIAATIDQAGFAGVVGSVAGDDTVLLIHMTAAEAKASVARFEAAMNSLTGR
jgi:transcriptional regulator of arginine metabolism